MLETSEFVTQEREGHVKRIAFGRMDVVYLLCTKIKKYRTQIQIHKCKLHTVYFVHTTYCGITVVTVVWHAVSLIACGAIKTLLC